MVRPRIRNEAHLNGLNCCIVRLRIGLLRLCIGLLRLRVGLLRLCIGLLRLRVGLLRLRVGLRKYVMLSGQRVCRLIVVVRELLRLLPRCRDFPLLKRRL